MKSAVEWLVDEIEKVFVNQDIKNTKVFEQAKQMEEENNKKAYIDGGINAITNLSGVNEK